MCWGGGNYKVCYLLHTLRGTMNQILNAHVLCPEVGSIRAPDNLDG